MCEYCENEKTILINENIHTGMLSFYYDATISTRKIFEDFEYNQKLFIDRSYLRLVDENDCECMDNGEKVKINYCPFCGRKFNDDNI